jgi:predicted PurR-regulated permease PerM
MINQNTSLASILSKVAVWGLIFAILYVLKSFFLLIFLTFVFAYIQESGVINISKWVPNRSLRVVIVGTALLGIIIGLLAFILPQVKDQGELFIKKLPAYMETLDREIVRIQTEHPTLANILATISPDEALIVESNENNVGEVSKKFLQGIFEANGSGKEVMTSVVGTLRNLGGSLLTIGSAFLLSLLFSFLIVLDLPRLTAEVRSLRQTKLRFIYDEVSSSIYHFGKVMGQALEAQFFIALLNTVLTSIGIAILGFGEQIPFLGMIVFFCSFIPVVGVIISSIPICLVALQTAGIWLMLLSILLIVIIHMIEAYILNPKIYGHHMRLNPVVVLIILTIGGKMFQVWGLVLGVPICTYIFGHAIRNAESSSVSKL